MAVGDLLLVSSAHTYASLPLFEAAKRLLVRTLQRSESGRDVLRVLVAAVRGWRRLGAVRPIDKERLRADAQAELDGFLAAGRKLVLPRAVEPTISILLVLYNQAALTRRCLESIAAAGFGALEVIIVDNASRDATADLLARVDGATVFANTENLGYLRAVNQAAAAARGAYLLLLNNDAELQPGSLATALEALVEQVAVGAVGARIILPDGTLQEAGSIIWNDGSCLGYGRGKAPEAPEAMFRRPVDFCSGAFLLIRQSLFEALGGFDESLAPAYYEETDLCMRIRAAGYSILYDPRVVIRHFEFGSAASRDWAEQQQIRNRSRFVAKHQAALTQHSAPDLRNLPVARMRPPAPAPVLILDDRIAQPWRGAGYPRARAMLESVLGTGRFVTLYPLAEPERDWAEVRRAIPWDVEVMLGNDLLGLKSFLAERPGHYRTLIVSRPHNMAYLAPLLRRHPHWFRGTRIIYDAEAVFALREEGRHRLAGRAWSAAKRARQLHRETRLAADAHTVVTVSEREAALFRRAGHRDVRVLGHAMVPQPLRDDAPGRSGLLFVGNLDYDQSPNVDGLVWFVRDVYPLLGKLLGQAPELTVVGPSGSEVAQRLAGPGITLLGRIDDLQPIYRQHRLFVAPTRYAAGLPHKIHEATAHGLPTVATTLLGRQLGWVDGKEILLADTADGFAWQCARMLGTPDLWNDIRRAAHARVASDCDPDRFRRTMLDLLA